MNAANPINNVKFCVPQTVASKT